MEYINGKGILYNIDGEQIIASVDYHITNKPSEQFSLGEWWGHLKPHDAKPILQLGEYIIELEDKRRGKIILSRIHAQSGFQKIMNLEDADLLNKGEFEGRSPSIISPPSPYKERGIQGERLVKNRN